MKSLEVGFEFKCIAFWNLLSNFLLEMLCKLSFIHTRGVLNFLFPNTQAFVEIHTLSMWFSPLWDKNKTYGSFWTSGFMKLFCLSLGMNLLTFLSSISYTFILKLQYLQSRRSNTPSTFKEEKVSLQGRVTYQWQACWPHCSFVSMYQFDPVFSERTLSFQDFKIELFCFCNIPASII